MLEYAHIYLRIKKKSIHGIIINVGNIVITNSVTTLAGPGSFFCNHSNMRSIRAQTQINVIETKQKSDKSCSRIMEVTKEKTI